MPKEIISATEAARAPGFVPYELKISDGSSIMVWARPRIDTTSVVRSSDNLKEVEPSDGEDIYVHRDRYYRYVPGSPYPLG